MGALVNLTDHSATQIVGHDPEGYWQVVAVVKATFTWTPEGKSLPAPPLPITDGHGGADLGPPKPRVDVLVAGSLTFPAPVDEIDVCLSIGSRIRKVVRVFGDRVWLPHATKDLAPSRPRPIATMPVTWERSFGGTDPEQPMLTDRRNPIGTGIAGKAKILEGRPVPNFEDPRSLLTSWKSRSAPTGFGPIAAHWEPRVRLAGTYDDDWQKKRWPRLPLDFDPAFFNMAPLDQQLDAYPAGEDVTLTHMTSASHDRLALPPFELPVTFETKDDFIEEMAVVDTVVIEPAEGRFSLVARAAARLDAGAASLRRTVVGEQRARPKDEALP